MRVFATDIGDRRPPEPANRSKCCRLSECDNYGMPDIFLSGTTQVVLATVVCR